MLLQALSDESVAVVTEAIRFLTSVVEAGHIRKRALLAISGRLVPKLQEHTSTAVLSAAAEFMAAAFRHASDPKLFQSRASSSQMAGSSSFMNACRADVGRVWCLVQPRGSVNGRRAIRCAE